MNREAGAVFEADDNPFLNYTTTVFDYDWNQAYKLVIGQTYTAAQVCIPTMLASSILAHMRCSLPSSLTRLRSR